ncbi:alpha/beta hydrolase [Geomonas sp. Red32]|uniref:alpha/beta hydrolase n=1 Tax=Geomonas sp. Red32 TaxID=2912856 RepID=UPI00202CB9D8|nr:alpha/beta hydrolase [Geomonas sp. Red32]MCM0080718.1 alpha/beta hydrolase [Geomonas sp. Red32]
MKRLLIIAAFAIVLFLVGCAVFQRKLLYYPTHHGRGEGLSPWKYQGKTIGFAREVAAPHNVWLMLHGNAGEAGDRQYALDSFSKDDSVYILEYPGYGGRPGAPSLSSINRAAAEGYRLLRSKFPATPVCVAGESLGTGPASTLAMLPHPPDKIVLITPFDVLAHVASYHFPYLPARLLLLDNWNNAKALHKFPGRVEIFAAHDDSVIPPRFARALAAAHPSIVFHEIPGDHNDWSRGSKVSIRNP